MFGKSGCMAWITDRLAWSFYWRGFAWQSLTTVVLWYVDVRWVPCQIALRLQSLLQLCGNCRPSSKRFPCWAPRMQIVCCCHCRGWSVHCREPIRGPVATACATNWQGKRAAILHGMGVFSVHYIGPGSFSCGWSHHSESLKLASLLTTVECKWRLAKNRNRRRSLGIARDWTHIVVVSETQSIDFLLLARWTGIVFRELHAVFAVHVG